MGIELKKSGVFIPNTVLEKIGLEEFEVEISEKELKIRPKSYTKYLERRYACIFSNTSIASFNPYMCMERHN